MATNKHTKALVAANISDGLLRDHCSRERWLCVPQDIDAAIARRERQIEVLRAMKVEIEGEINDGNLNYRGINQARESESIDGISEQT